MATQTTNYGLTKPSYGDNADIAVINSNMDKIDAKMKEIEDAGGSGASTWSEVSEKPFETIGSGLSVDESGALNATGGGSGSSVSWNQIQTSGTKIAEVTIDGTKTEVFAPTGGGGEPTGEPVSLVDTMTSSEDSNGKVTSSSEFTSMYAAWMAFNGVQCDASSCTGGWLASASDEMPYIQYEFKKGKRYFDNISIETYNNQTTFSRNVAIQVSNDGNNWVEIGVSNIEFKNKEYSVFNLQLEKGDAWKFIRLQFDGKLYFGANQSAGTLSKVSVYGYTDVTLESVNTKIDDLIALLKSKGVID